MHFTIPLLTTADGKKMGKTESGAVWIDQNKVSSYDYYQYWVNVQDADVIKLMKTYTFMTMEEIQRFAQLQGADIREAKHKLALETTALVHGREAAEQAQQAWLFAMFKNKGSAQKMLRSMNHLPMSYSTFLLKVVFALASRMHEDRYRVQRLKLIMVQVRKTSKESML